MKRLTILAISIPIILAVLACQSNASSGMQIATIAKTVTSNQIFQVTPKNVAEVLQDIVRVTSRGPGKHLYTFSGSNAALGVAWAQVEFQPGVDGLGWTLLQIRIGFAPSDTKGTKTYPALLNAITERVGRPAWSDSDASQKRAGWTIGDYNDIILQEGLVENPLEKGRSAKLVVVNVAIAQGEAEN
jgi:hypothetical protein